MKVKRDTMWSMCKMNEYGKWDWIEVWIVAMVIGTPIFLATGTLWFLAHW
jgi:hypothetical protein